MADPVTLRERIRDRRTGRDHEVLAREAEFASAAILRQGAKVPIAQSRAEIEKLLKAAKATRVITMDDHLEAIVMFMLAGRLIKILVPIAGNANDQVRRSRWRALLLTIKAKREAIENGIETVEQAFLSHVVLPDGRTMGQWAEPALQVAYERGEMPNDPLRLPAPSSTTARGRDA